MTSRSSVFRVSARALKRGARSGPDLGLGPEKWPARSDRPCASPHRHWGVAPSRIEPTTIPVVVVPSSSRHAASRRSSTAEMALNEGRVELAVGQAGEWRSGRTLLLLIQGTRSRPGWHLGRSHARRRSGPESPQPKHALLHANASVRPRRARRAAGGTSRPRRAATRLRQCVAAEQLRGDDGARLRLLLPSEAGARLATDETPVPRRGCRVNSSGAVPR